MACAPKPMTRESLPSVRSETEQGPIPVDRSKWSWIDRQGRIRTYEQTLDKLREIMNDRYIPGLSVVLKQARFWESNPDVFHFDLGIEAPQSGKAIDARTVVRADRLGQAIIAYLVLKLVTAGQFDLDRPLSKYVTRSALEDSLYKDIAQDRRYQRLTARRILSHQSGLANSRLDHPEKKLTFVASPGNGFIYSDEGFGYLQFVLEQTSGKSLDELAKTFVFDPLGMTYSRLSRRTPLGNPGMPAANADSHSGYLNPDPPWVFFTTASDFTNFMWTVRVGGGDLSYEAFTSFIVYPTVSIRSPQILATGPSEGNTNLPPKLAWCLGWGTYRLPKIELGACSFLGEKSREIESYATVFYSEHSTALTIFVIPSSSKSVLPLILRELLGDMDNPLPWLGF
jgi:CubicO group peptidase (beta-lactamase class C family)